MHVCCRPCEHGSCASRAWYRALDMCVSQAGRHRTFRGQHSLWRLGLLLRLNGYCCGVGGQLAWLSRSGQCCTLSSREQQGLRGMRECSVAVLGGGSADSRLLAGRAFCCSCQLPGIFHIMTSVREPWQSSLDESSMQSQRSAGCDRADGVAFPLHLDVALAEPRLTDMAI